jgi:hypothetical protein
MRDKVINGKVRYNVRYNVVWKCSVDVRKPTCETLMASVPASTTLKSSMILPFILT